MVSADKYIVNIFKVVLPGVGDSTKALYANGRHQCKVEVIIDKERRFIRDEWEVGESEPLTPEELASLTITRYSANENEKLPTGWSCDTTKNEFDTGLRGGSPIASSAGTTGGGEVVERYLRVDARVAIEAQRFMARVVVAGKTYTTYNVGAGSSVIIEPTRPYEKLRAAQLVAERDDALSANPVFLDIDVYYWSLPAGLRLVKNLGIDNAVDIAGVGRALRPFYSDFRMNSTMLVGGVIDIDSSVTTLRVIDVCPVKGHENKTFRIDKYPTQMRAISVWARMFLRLVKGRDVVWRILDNYGVEHSFLLGSEDEPNVLVLRDHG